MERTRRRAAWQGLLVLAVVVAALVLAVIFVIAVRLI
jgi:hypothetical protein